MVENSLSHELAWAGFPICRVLPRSRPPPGQDSPSAPSQRAVLWVVTAHSERLGTKWLKTYVARTLFI